MKGQLEEIAAWERMATAVKAPANLTMYTGDYMHELYGKLTISRRGDKLHLRFHSHPELTATMQYMGGDDWLVT